MKQQVSPKHNSTVLELDNNNLVDNGNVTVNEDENVSTSSFQPISASTPVNGYSEL